MILRNIRRENSIDAAGWHAVMDGLAVVTSITELNGVDGLGGLFVGGLDKADLRSKSLGRKEAVVAVSRLLVRNEQTLEKLDLRCPCVLAAFYITCQFDYAPCVYFVWKRKRTRYRFSDIS